MTHLKAAMSARGRPHGGRLNDGLSLLLLPDLHHWSKGLRPLLVTKEMIIKIFVFVSKKTASGLWEKEEKKKKKRARQGSNLQSLDP